MVRDKQVESIDAERLTLQNRSLDKTKLLLRSLSDLLKDKASPFASIEYKALDLEKASLVDSLDTLLELEPTSVKAGVDSTPRVQIGGLHADYWEGLAFLKKQDAAFADDGETRSEQQPGKSGSSNRKNTSILWLGSSVGNFHRDEAVDFLRNVQLAPGDTMLIGVDSCDDKEMIETAYNDPEVCLAFVIAGSIVSDYRIFQGVTASFILEGVNQAGITLHGSSDSALNANNFDYVNRYDKAIGRHEVSSSCGKRNINHLHSLTSSLPGVRSLQSRRSGDSATRNERQASIEHLAEEGRVRADRGLRLHLITKLICAHQVSSYRSVVQVHASGSSCTLPRRRLQACPAVERQASLTHDLPLGTTCCSFPVQFARPQRNRRQDSLEPIRNAFSRGVASDVADVGYVDSKCFCVLVSRLCTYHSL